MANAIETRYKGYRFRSRLEARWAVYFDAIGLTWEYEPEGYEFGSLRYLPDFWLSQVYMFAEVKPKILFDDYQTSADFNAAMMKLHSLVAHTGYPVIVLDGPPTCKPYTYIGVNRDEQKFYVDDCLLSMYHNYPITERRFYTNTGCTYPLDNSQVNMLFGASGMASDVPAAVQAALSARFEFGESGINLR